MCPMTVIVFEKHVKMYFGSFSSRATGDIYCLAKLLMGRASLNE